MEINEKIKLNKYIGAFIKIIGKTVKIRCSPRYCN